MRYWALNNNLAAYEKPLATFISQFTEEQRNIAPADLEDLVAGLKTAHQRVVELFGSNAFVYSRDGRSKFNAAVFDAQLVACGKLSKTRFDALKKRKKALRDAYAKLENDPDFSKSVTLATSDESALRGRIQKVTAMLKAL